MSKSLLRPGESLDSVAYFTAYMVWEPGKLQRHQQYVSALQSTGVEPIVSKFLAQKKYCSAGNRTCKVINEKQTDVAFATRIIGDCLRGNVDRIVLITADSDQVPTLAMVRALAPNIAVSIAFPPGRRQIGRELGDLAHDIRELKRGRLEQCLFPRNVTNAEGKVVARCPAAYDHPQG
jgi:hypothetical protein